MQITLADNIRLHIISSKNFKTDTACILIRRKLSKREAALNALIPRILAMGSSEYASASRIFAQAEAMHGSAFDAQLVKKGEEQLIQILLEYPPKRARQGGGVRLSEAFGFLAEVMLNPLVKDGGFLPHTVETQKNILRAEMASHKNDLGEYARLRLIEEAFPEEAFSIPALGFTQDLEGVTGASLFSHYINILNTSPIEIMIVTQSSPEDCESSARHAFDKLIKIRTSPDYFPAPSLGSNAASRPRIINEEADNSQGKLAVGYKAAVSPRGDEFLSFLLFSEILGGNADSRLFRLIREEHGLAYYVFSTVYRFKGFLAVHTGVEPANFALTLDLIDQEVAYLASGNLPSQDFESAKRTLAKRFESVSDSQASLLDFHLTQYLLDDPATPQLLARSVRSLASSCVAYVAQELRKDTVFTISRTLGSV